MMRLDSGTTDPYSHRCRIVLFEKGMDFEVIDVVDVEDRWLAELLANQVSMAMSNARLIEQSRRRLAELAALRDVSLQMTSTLELDRVLDAICANVMSLTAAEDTHIYLYDAEQDTFAKSAVLWRSGVRKLAASQTQHAVLIDRVRRSGRPIVIDNARAHDLYATPDAEQWGIKSIAGFPLKRAGEVLVVFTVAYVVVHRFGEDELRVLNLLANQASIAIDNALSGIQRLFRVLGLVPGWMAINGLFNLTGKALKNDPT